jgi:hypothetical protein
MEPPQILLERPRLIGTGITRELQLRRFWRGVLEHSGLVQWIIGIARATDLVVSEHGGCRWRWNAWVELERGQLLHRGPCQTASVVRAVDGRAVVLVGRRKRGRFGTRGMRASRPRWGLLTRVYELMRRGAHSSTDCSSGRVSGLCMHSLCAARARGDPHPAAHKREPRSKFFSFRVWDLTASHSTALRRRRGHRRLALSEAT